MLPHVFLVNFALAIFWKYYLENILVYVCDHSVITSYGCWRIVITQTKPRSDTSGKTSEAAVQVSRKRS